jgi:hypothetical protein
MNNLIINPQFIGSQQTHRTKVLHRIELQGEHGIEDHIERESHLANHYGPIGPVGTTHTSLEGEQG